MRGAERLVTQHPGLRSALNSMFHVYSICTVTFSNVPVKMNGN